LVNLSTKDAANPLKVKKKAEIVKEKARKSS
jgi:hypothetical protein